MYSTLLDVSRRKTPAIVAGELDKLTAITEEEQLLVDKVNQMDAKRWEAMKEIAGVLKMDAETLKLDMLVRALERRPEEQQKLADTVNRLGNIVHQVRNINIQNKELVDSALEMVDFEMNMLKAAKTAPQTANYNRGAYNTGASLGVSSGKFDAKQ